MNDNRVCCCMAYCGRGIQKSTDIISHLTRGEYTKMTGCSMLLSLTTHQNKVVLMKCHIIIDILDKVVLIRTL